MRDYTRNGVALFITQMIYDGNLTNSSVNLETARGRLALAVQLPGTPETGVYNAMRRNSALFSYVFMPSSRSNSTSTTAE